MSNWLEIQIVNGHCSECGSRIPDNESGFALCKMDSSNPFCTCKACFEKRKSVDVLIDDTIYKQTVVGR